MLTLYYGSGSPYAWRVNLALEHKALPYERLVLSFGQGDNKKPGYMQFNPRGKVPVRIELDRIATGLDGEFFGGDEPGAADFSLYTILGFVRRCEIRIPEVRLDDMIGERYSSWMKRIEALPFFDECIPPTWKAKPSG